MTYSGRIEAQRRTGYLGRELVVGFLIAVMSSALIWVVWIYGNGLRDARYLDGWVLAAGMGLQLLFHIAVKTTRMSPKSMLRWRRFHIFAGLMLVSAFVSHSNFTLPDTGFEWVLWFCFVLVMASGIFGTYLAWSFKARRGTDDVVSADRIPIRRGELASDAEAAVSLADPAAAAIGLPMPQHDAWIADLYASHIRDFFSGQRNSASHIVGSQRPLKLLTGEIDNLMRYVDKQSQVKLEFLKTLIVEKDRLDYAAVHFGMTKGWLLVHVPVTYALIILSVLHIVVVYAFSAGGG
ncbi:MAG: hypothetical protein SH859_10650 [Hyphomicrobium aestuarii]|nr:hypothetical protein [Hyphomicrobium aestuarii]